MKEIVIIPYGLLIVAKHLQGNGYKVEILNLHHEINKNVSKQMIEILLILKVFGKKHCGIK